MDVIELDWSAPFDVDGVACCVAQHEGRWLIVSNKAPRFGLDAETKSAAEDQARRAIAFWREHS